MVRRLTATAFRIDRRALEPVFVVRSALGVTIAILGGFLTAQPILAVAAAIGALTAGFGSLQGVYRTRAATMLGMAAAMAFSTAVGLFVAHSVALILIALAVWGFAYGITASLGPAVSAIGVNATIALIVFEHLPQPWGLGAACVAMVFAGGALQTLLLVATWPIQRYPQERHALASAYRDLASFVSSSHPAATVPLSASLRAVAATLADPRPFGRRAAAAAFQTLLDEAQRMRATLALLTAGGDPEYARERPAIAGALSEIAAALDAARAPDDPALEARLNEPHEDAAVRALFGQLRAAWRSAGVPLHGIALPRSLPTFGHVPDLEEPLAILQANLRWDAPFFRHAVRLAVVLVFAGAVGEIFALHRGYWVTLTAALVLRPDFTTTFARGFARIGGTILGVLLATAIVLAVPNTPHVYLALAIFFAAIGYAAFQLNYALFSLTITAYVVFLLALLGVPERDAILNRLLATVCGGVLAMLSYVLWPTWEAPRTREQLRALIEADLDHSRLLLAGLAEPSRRDLARMRAHRANVWKVRAAAEESLERMLSEPEGTHETNPETALGIMAASQRIGFANTVFSSLYQDPQTPAYPQLAPLLTALESVTPAYAGGLREAYSAVARAFAGDESPTTRALLTNCDRLVDSINTIVERTRQG